MAQPLGSRFAKLWTASTTSALGSGLATIAAPLFVAAHTKNPLIVSATTGVAWLPWLLFALPGGVLVDRVDRRRLMVTIDWIRVAVMGVLATAMLAGWSSIALLDVALFLINTGEIVFRSASQAMIPAVVPRARLERANGWLVGGTTLTENMIAGPLGGFLFVLAACVPFYVNAGTYAASAVLVGLVAGTYRAACPATGGDDQARARRVRQELAEGFRWLAGQRVLRTMTVLIGLLNLTLTAATAVLVLLVKERLHLGAVGYGTLFTCMAAGALLGSASGDWLDQAGHRDLDHPDRPAGRGRAAPGPGHLAQRVPGRLHAVRVRRARRAVDHRGQLAAAAADPAGDDGPGGQHRLVHRGRRQLRRRRARRRDRGPVRDHRALLGRVRRRGPGVRQHLAGIQPGRRGRGLRRACAVWNSAAGVWPAFGDRITL